MNPEIIQNLKQLSDRLNEIHKRLDDIQAENKAVLEDAIIELASIVVPDEEEEEE